MSISAVVGGIIDKVSGVGGELGEVQAAIRNCKPRYPQEVIERYDWAVKIVQDLDHDRSVRSDQIGFEESQVNRDLYNEAVPIIHARVQAEKVCEAEMKRLQEQKNEIERSINFYRGKKRYLQTTYQSQYNEQMAKLQREIKDKTYVLNRDKAYLLNQFGDLDKVIDTSKQERATATGEAAMALEITIQEAGIKQKQLAYQYQSSRPYFDELQNGIDNAEQQIKWLENDYAGALAQCDEELIRLIGRCD